MIAGDDEACKNEKPEIFFPDMTFDYKIAPEEVFSENS